MSNLKPVKINLPPEEALRRAMQASLPADDGKRSGSRGKKSLAKRKKKR